MFGAPQAEQQRVEPFIGNDANGAGSKSVAEAEAFFERFQFRVFV